jgi:alkylation response protein AidB-like acyl-CoA dehydrogenase
MGIRAHVQLSLFSTDCKFLKKSSRKEGMGAIIAINTLYYSQTRCRLSGSRIAAGALDDALAYSRQRVRSVDASISSFQAVQHMLANMVLKLKLHVHCFMQQLKTIDAVRKSLQRVCNVQIVLFDVAMRVTVDALHGNGWGTDICVNINGKNA